eukprot:5482673-Amphidinium_carterae.1
MRSWQRKLITGTLVWPLEENVENALGKGRGRGPIKHLKTLANRVGWVPQPGGWQSEGQYFTWHEADLKVKWDSAKALLTEVTQKRLDFAAWKPVLAHKLSDTSRKTLTNETRTAVNAALGGVWHEVRTHKAFTVGETCVRCQVHALAQRETTGTTSGGCRHYSCLRQAPWLASCATGTGNSHPRTGLGRHSSDPQHRRCGVGYYIHTQERVWFPLPRLKQSVCLAEFLAVARALEECQPHDIVSEEDEGTLVCPLQLSLIHISEPTRPRLI